MTWPWRLWGNCAALQFKTFFNFWMILKPSTLPTHCVDDQALWETNWITWRQILGSQSFCYFLSFWLQSFSWDCGTINNFFLNYLEWVDSLIKIICNCIAINPWFCNTEINIVFNIQIEMSFLISMYEPISLLSLLEIRIFLFFLLYSIYQKILGNLGKII